MWEQTIDRVPSLQRKILPRRKCWPQLPLLPDIPQDNGQRARVWWNHHLRSWIREGWLWRIHLAGCQGGAPGIQIRPRWWYVTLYFNCEGTRYSTWRHGVFSRIVTWLMNNNDVKIIISYYLDSRFLLSFTYYILIFFIIFCGTTKDKRLFDSFCLVPWKWMNTNINSTSINKKPEIKGFFLALQCYQVKWEIAKELSCIYLYV